MRVCNWADVSYFTLSNIMRVTFSFFNLAWGVWKLIRGHCPEMDLLLHSLLLHRTFRLRHLLPCAYSLRQSHPKIYLVSSTLRFAQRSILDRQNQPFRLLRLLPRVIHRSHLHLNRRIQLHPLYFSCQELRDSVIV